MALAHIAIVLKTHLAKAAKKNHLSARTSSSYMHLLIIACMVFETSICHPSSYFIQGPNLNF